MSATNSVLYSYLLSLGACQDALDFVATQSSDYSVDYNERGRYFIWLARKSGTFSNYEILQMKVDCLEDGTGLNLKMQDALIAAQNYLGNPGNDSLEEMNLAHQTAENEWIASPEIRNYLNWGALVSSNLSAYDATGEGYAERNPSVCSESIKNNFSQTFKDFLNSNTILTDGLVRHFDSGVPFSLTSSTSTRWLNLTDSTLHQITSGSYNEENSIKSVAFNGTSTFVNIGTPLLGGTNYTKEAWVYASATNNSRNIISSENNVFWIANGTLYGGVAGQYTEVSSASFPTNRWKHVALTFNDSTNTMTLYIDGVQVDQKTSVSGSYIQETLRIGAHYSGGNPVSFWSGRISIARIYSRSLSAVEILRNFNATRRRFGA